MHQSYLGLEERLKLLSRFKLAQYNYYYYQYNYYLIINDRSCLEERTGMVKLLVFYYALESSNLANLAKLAKEVLIEIGFVF
jgi:hypothetical protein